MYSIWYKDKRRKNIGKPFNSRMSVFSAGQKAIKATIKSPGTSASDPSSCSNCLAAKAFLMNKNYSINGISRTIKRRKTTVNAERIFLHRKVTRNAGHIRVKF